MLGNVTVFNLYIENNDILYYALKYWIRLIMPINLCCSSRRNDSTKEISRNDKESSKSFASNAVSCKNVSYPIPSKFDKPKALSSNSLADRADISKGLTLPAKKVRFKESRMI